MYIYKHLYYFNVCFFHYYLKYSRIYIYYNKDELSQEHCIEYQAAKEVADAKLLEKC